MPNDRLYIKIDKDFLDLIPEEQLEWASEIIGRLIPNEEVRDIREIAKDETTLETEQP